MLKWGGPRVNIGDQGGGVGEIFISYSHPNVNAGNRANNLKKILSVLRQYHQLERFQSHPGPSVLPLALSNWM